MKLKEIYKKLVEDNNHQVTKGRKLITIDCNDSTGDFEKLLFWWQTMGNIGHSATIHCDVERPENLIKLYCDGDGVDKIKSIQVKMLPAEGK